MVTRRPSPVMILVLGLICAVTAAGCWAVTSTIRNRETVLREAGLIAKSEPVRAEYAWKIADTIAPHTAGTAAAALNDANATARKVVESSAFQQAFATALPAIYADVVNGTPGDVTLDPDLVNQAFVEAGAVPPPNLQLVASRSQLPNLRNVIDRARKLAGILGPVAGVLIGLGLALAPQRGRAIMRIGRWLITTGIITIVVFWALPTLALLPLGGWLAIAGIVLATGDWMVVPASVLSAFGIAIVVMGRAGEAESRRRELAVIPRSSGRTPPRPSIH